MVYNEKVFLPIWLQHYGTALGYENLFVIDDGSNDGSTADCRIVNLLRKKRAPLDEHDRALLIGLLHEQLLGFYDWVIYVDCDELIVVDPVVGQSLIEYLETCSRKSINAIGLNIVHDRQREGDLDVNKPLLVQRRFVQPSSRFSKPAISSVPTRWDPGFHSSNQPRNLDHKLILFHLRSVDVKLSEERLKVRNQMQFSKRVLNKKLSFQFRWNREKLAEEFFSYPREQFDSAGPLEMASLLNSIDDNKTDDIKTMPIYRIPPRFQDCIHPSQVNRVIDQVSLEKLFDECLQKMIATRSGYWTDWCPCGSGKRYMFCHAWHSARSG